jgi:hypothetical protein
MPFLTLLMWIAAVYALFFSLGLTISQMARKVRKDRRSGRALPARMSTKLLAYEAFVMVTFFTWLHFVQVCHSHHSEIPTPAKHSAIQDVVTYSSLVYPEP